MSEDIGPRPGGTEWEWEGARYIGSTLESYGYSVEYQTFAVANQYIGHMTLPDGTTWMTGASTRGAFTDDAPVTGGLVDAGTGLAAEYPADVTGKIVLMTAGSSAAARNTQATLAVNRGAVGMLLINTAGARGAKAGANNPSLSVDVAVPVLGVGQAHGEWLRERLAAGETDLTIRNKVHSNLESVNVIATRPAQTPAPGDPVVVVGAHLDSVVGAPGANDDASGVGLGLELARVMKSYNTDKELRFAFWGSEERGLLGARHYVNQLSDAEANRIVAMFQADMVATSHLGATHFYAMTNDGRTNVVTDAAVAAGARQGDSSVLPGHFGSSDHVPFAQRGIPAALFIWMHVASWSPLVYEIERIYHTPEDTIALNISPERMQIALNIVGAAVFDVARKPVPALDQQPEPVLVP
ncbi:MAG TPA: M28 family metallopeptidase [Micromonospora sp.]|nr:M28 family metallopeptidase [Micromonospora sp.]